VGILKKILAAIAALAVGAALWFRSQRDQARAERARARADHEAAAAQAQTDAQAALDDTRERQAAERTAPDTEKRDDLEGGW